MKKRKEEKEQENQKRKKKNNIGMKRYKRKFQKVKRNKNTKVGIEEKINKIEVGNGERTERK